MVQLVLVFQINVINVSFIITGVKDLGQFYKYLVSWWHENVFVRVGPNGEPIATPSIWLERPEILWLILGSSLSCTPIVWSIGTFMKKEVHTKDGRKYFRRLLTNILKKIKIVFNWAIGSKQFEVGKKNIIHLCVPVFISVYQAE